MKKRIISLILVLVMLCLALASCGAYSIANEDITSYTSFDADAKSKFEAAWATLVIKDGDFTTDPTTRFNKVMDSIYEDLANAIAEDATELKTGVPNGRDIVYYNYYYTMETEEGKTVYFSTANMKSGSTSKFQLGLEDPSEFQKQLIALITDKDIKDYIYTTETSGTVAEGDVVFITYTYTVSETKEDGSVVESKPVTVTNEMLKLTKDSSALVNYVLEKKSSINATIEDFKDGATSYTGIKINWRAKGEALGSAKNTPYETETKIKDITGTEYDLNGKELTYYVYPSHFIDIPDFTKENFINVILGDSITFSAITRTLFGEKFEEKTAEEKKTILDLYLTADKDGNNTVTLEALVESIAKAQSEYDSAVTAFEKAETTVSTKQSAVDDAQKKFDDETDEAKKAERETALNTAKTELETAKTALVTETTNRDTKLADRDAKVNTLFAIVEANQESDSYDVAQPDQRLNLTEGYERLTYEYLRDKYNEEVRMNLAEAIYKLFETSVTITAIPEKAVDTTYERLMENYEYEFYNGTYDTTTNQSNYSAHNGSFKSYLIEAVSEANDNATIADYKAACDMVRKNAEDYVKPILAIYAISNAFEVIVSDEEFEDYKESEDGSYNVDSYNYGENSVRYAYQFDKLMNFILNYEEQPDGSYKYTKVSFTFEDAE